jgi:glycosyltransferase involved in cell wall biosynthesis
LRKDRILFSGHVDHFTIGLVSALNNIFDMYVITQARYEQLSRQLVVPKYLRYKRTFYRLALNLPLYFSLVHANTAVVGSAVARKHRLLVTEHGFPYPEQEPAYRAVAEKELQALLQLSDAGVPIVSISNYSGYMLESLHGVKAHSIIYHGVLDSFRRKSPREPPQGTHHILYNSRLISFKNPQLLFHAFGKIKSRIDARLSVRGDGPLRGELESLSRKLGFSDDLTFHAVTQFSLVPLLYESSSIYVHTCDKEPFGLAILEAMASGLPVIVPDAGGALEVAGEAAVVYRQDDAQDLADKILAVAQDPAMYREQSRLSLERSADFSWKKAASQYTRLYEQILNA